MSINKLANLARTAGLENLLIESDIIEEFNKEIEVLDKVNEEVIYGDVSILPVYSLNEGYGITLDSLVELSEAYEISLEESMNKIKEINNINEEDMYCVLPEDINKQVTVEEFCDLVDYLNENNINVSWSSELLCEEFITEAGKLDSLMNKVIDKIQNSSIKSLEKTIQKCEESNKKLNKELEQIDKMSEEDAKTYVRKQSIKNIGISTGYFGGAMTAAFGNGILIATNPLVGIPVYVGLLKGVTKIGNAINRKGKSTVAFGVAEYKKAIKNSIKINNRTIRECNKKIKSKK